MRALRPEGPAAEVSHLIRPGDVLLEVDGVSVVGVSPAGALPLPPPLPPVCKHHLNPKP